jgi:large subunit ribosomal protein L9
MKVIIKKTGEVKEVSFGYATNYLFPQGLAFKATANKLEQLKTEQAHLVEVKQRQQVAACREAKQLAGQEINFKVKKGQGQKIHGSITSLDIADKLNIDKTEVGLDKPIKEIGTHEVEIKLKGADSVKVKVVVKE